MAGATALDANQEWAIHSAITNFWNANRLAHRMLPKQPQEMTITPPCLPVTKTQQKRLRTQLASLIAPRQQARLYAEAALSTQVLTILQSDQIAALQKSVGKEVLLRLVTSLAGSGGGFGRGPMNSRPSGNQR